MHILLRIVAPISEIPQEWSFTETVGHYLKHHSQFSLAIAFSILSFLIAHLALRKVPSISQSINESIKKSICVTQINIFPVKSCAGLSLQSASFSNLGFHYDRQWAIVKADKSDLDKHCRPRAQFTIKQSTSQSNNQSINRSKDATNQSTNQSINQSQTFDKVAVKKFLDSLEPNKMNQLIPHTMREYPHMATIGVRLIDTKTNQSIFQSTNQSNNQSINQSTNESNNSSTNESNNQSVNHSSNIELVLSFPGRDDVRVPIVPPVSSRVLPLRMWTGGHQLMLASVYESSEMIDWLSDVIGSPSVLVTFIDGNPDHHFRPLDSEFDISQSINQSINQAQFSDNYGFLLANQASLRDVQKRVQAAYDRRKHIEMSSFRPSLVIDGPARLIGAWSEDSWSEIEIGPCNQSINPSINQSINQYRFTCAKPSDRCKMPTINQSTGVPDPDYEPITNMREYRQCTNTAENPDSKVYFGEFLIQHQSTGVIRVGDQVTVKTKRKQFLQKSME